MSSKPGSARALAIIAAVIATMAVFGGRTVVAAGQSLGDVARKEDQRRKAVKSSGKVYTNRDLGPEGSRPPAPAPAAGSQAGSADAQSPPPADPAAPTEEAEDPTKTEEYWRGRIEAARADLQRQELFHDALQSRVNALSTDFVNRDDPAQRAAIGLDRQRALAEMERVKETIGKIRQQIADIEEEARQAGVPPGWVR